ncbi:phage holin family protein [Streptomyces sp. NRRL S-340]|uniref:phage holin family protein n=1 Tax=Streptomyces sp. NRRL S-340 TaxID=1463901 RepID=UPI000560C0A7|nr:phage holin family protein [Streptomyces sp. NRRL S-340]
MGTPGEGAAGAGRMGDAAARLGQDAAELARDEVRAVRDDLMAGLRAFGAGGALAAGSGLCGLLALWSAHEAVLRSLAAVMPRGRAAALLACVYGSGAAALALAARNRVNAAAHAAAEALEKDADDRRSTTAPRGTGPSAGTDPASGPDPTPGPEAPDPGA